MIYRVVAVFDIASQAYQRPLFVPAAGAAMRWFQDTIESNDKDNPMCGHPEDFQMFDLGSFNDFDATFDLLQRPNLLVHGSSFKKE